MLWTSVGVTAGIDLALVEEDFGHTLALEVAGGLVMYIKRPCGQSQFSMQLASQGVTHRDIQAVQSWVLEILHEPMPLAALAARAAMSERHFRRVFVQETGQTPSAFVDAARLEVLKPWERRRRLETERQLERAQLLMLDARLENLASEFVLKAAEDGGSVLPLTSLLNEIRSLGERFGPNEHSQKALLRFISCSEDFLRAARRMHRPYPRKLN